MTELSTMKKKILFGLLIGCLIISVAYPIHQVNKRFAGKGIVTKSMFQDELKIPPLYDKNRNQIFVFALHGDYDKLNNLKYRVGIDALQEDVDTDELFSKLMLSTSYSFSKENLSIIFQLTWYDELIELLFPRFVEAKRIKRFITHNCCYRQQKFKEIA